MMLMCCSQTSAFSWYVTFNKILLNKHTCYRFIPNKKWLSRLCSTYT